MKIFRLPILLALTLVAMISFNSISAGAQEAPETPALIYLIRHAEKPPPEENSPDLNSTGFKRAEAMPSLFVEMPGVPKPRLPRPDAIFATARTKTSNRPVETVTPLAQILKLPINHIFNEQATADIAAEILRGKYAGKVVLICWHHGQMTALASALGVQDPPAAWDPNVFDQLWKITYTSGQAKLTKLSQGLLPGDPP